jgi:hypothetical protein
VGGAALKSAAVKKVPAAKTVPVFKIDTADQTLPTIWTLADPPVR